jgi:hypothetical protein
MGNWQGRGIMAHLTLDSAAKRQTYQLQWHHGRVFNTLIELTFDFRVLSVVLDDVTTER